MALDDRDATFLAPSPPPLLSPNALLEQGAVLSGGGDASVHSFNDQLMFVLGEGGEHVQHQPASRRGGVDPVRHGLDVHSPVKKRFTVFSTVDQRAAEPVDPGSRPDSSAGLRWGRASIRPSGRGLLLTVSPQ